MNNAVIPWFMLVISSCLAAEGMQRSDPNATFGLIPECPRNWTRYDRTKSCLLVLPQRLRWAEAEQMCAKFGGHLASITDEYENLFAFGASHAFFIFYLFILLHCRKTEIARIHHVTNVQYFRG
jgi:hypothetical protein